MCTSSTSASLSPCWGQATAVNLASSNTTSTPKRPLGEHPRRRYPRLLRPPLAGLRLPRKSHNGESYAARHKPRGGHGGFKRLLSISNLHVKLPLHPHSSKTSSSAAFSNFARSRLTASTDTTYQPTTNHTHRQLNQNSNQDANSRCKQKREN
jgi:hypothetical protein